MSLSCFPADDVRVGVEVEVPAKPETSALERREPVNTNRADCQVAVVAASEDDLNRKTAMPLRAEKRS